MLAGLAAAVIALLLLRLTTNGDDPPDAETSQSRTELPDPRSVELPPATSGSDEAIESHLHGDGAVMPEKGA